MPFNDVRLTLVTLVLDRLLSKSIKGRSARVLECSDSSKNYPGNVRHWALFTAPCKSPHSLDHWWRNPHGYFRWRPVEHCLAELQITYVPLPGLVSTYNTDSMSQRWILLIFYWLCYTISSCEERLALKTSPWTSHVCMTSWSLPQQIYRFYTVKS